MVQNLGTQYVANYNSVLHLGSSASFQAMIDFPKESQYAGHSVGNTFAEARIDSLGRMSHRV